MAVAGIALAAAGPAQAEILDAAPKPPSSHEASLVKPHTIKAHETAKSFPEKSGFHHIMNARVRQSAIRFAKLPDKGPAKQTSIFTSTIGPNQITAINYGSPGRYGDRGYSITTLAPVLPNNRPDYSKLVSFEIRAGNTHLRYSKDPMSDNWLLGYEKTNRRSEPYAVLASANIEIARANAFSNELVVPLGAKKLAESNELAEQMHSDLRNAKPIQEYPYPLN